MPATTQVSTPAADAPSPRDAVARVIPDFVDVLQSKSLSTGQKLQQLHVMVAEQIDFPTLSRVMLGTAWDSISPQQRQAFVDGFSNHLMNIYAPLMTLYKDEQIRVADEVPESHGDRTVLVKVTDKKYGAERVLATVAFRMRQGERGWKAIDMTVEGVSVAKVFASQLRAVLAREGMEGVLKRLDGKNAQVAHATKPD